MAGGVNLYSYAGNNPVAYVDPYGLKEETCPPCIEEVAGILGMPELGAAVRGVAFVASAITAAKVASDAIDNARSKSGGVTVRIQAQGGGLEQSVVINSGAQGVISAVDGLSGLATLAAKIGPKETQIRRVRRHQLEVLLKHIEVDDEGGGVDLFQGHADLGGMSIGHGHGDLFKKVIGRFQGEPIDLKRSLS